MDNNKVGLTEFRRSKTSKIQERSIYRTSTISPANIPTITTGIDDENLSGGKILPMKESQAQKTGKKMTALGLIDSIKHSEYGGEVQSQTMVSNKNITVEIGQGLTIEDETIEASGYNEKQSLYLGCDSNDGRLSETHPNRNDKKNDSEGDEKSKSEISNLKSCEIISEKKPPLASSRINPRMDLPKITLNAEKIQFGPLLTRSLIFTLADRNSADDADEKCQTKSTVNVAPDDQEKANRIDMFQRLAKDFPKIMTSNYDEPEAQTTPPASRDNDP
jgi:hypothetical protein